MGWNLFEQRHHFADKGPYSQSYCFSSSYVWMWELDHKEGWAPKNSCFRIVLEKLLECLLDSKEIKPIHPKGSQPWIFIGRTVAETEAPVLWPPDAKNWPWWWGKIEGRRKRGQQRMRWLDGIINSIDMSLSWWWTGKPGMLQSMVARVKELDMTEWLNWTEKYT